MIREAYTDAAAFFVETVAGIGREAWSRPALGEWTVRDLAGHTNRAFVTVEAYLDKPCQAAEMTRPVEYYLRAAATLGDPAMVTARGREAGQALGPDPGAAVRATAERVLARVGREAGRCPAGHAGGRDAADRLPALASPGTHRAYPGYPGRNRFQWRSAAKRGNGVPPPHGRPGR